MADSTPILKSSEILCELANEEYAKKEKHFKNEIASKKMDIKQKQEVISRSLIEINELENEITEACKMWDYGDLEPFRKVLIPPPSLYKEGGIRHK
jgi:hypothetical protein